MKQFVGKFLSAHLSHVGTIVAKHPRSFLAICLLITLVQCAGLVRFNHLQDLNEIFRTRNGRVERDRETVEKYFPKENADALDLGRATKMTSSGAIIIAAKDGGTIFRKEIAEEVLEFDRDTASLNVEWNGQRWNFSSVCSPWWFGHCLQNSATEILKRLNEFQRGGFRPKYPIDWDSYSRGVTVTAMNLGGVETDEEGRIVSAKALRFVFQLEYRDSEKKDISYVWEKKYVEEVQRKRYKYIDVGMFTSLSVPFEFTRTTLDILPIMSVAIIVFVVYTVITCLSRDPVRSKPWLGIAATVSAVLGITSAFGFVTMCGLPYIDLLMSVPFLMIGIGVDDAFVLIAAWRRTNPNDPVEKRMGETYSEAAVSITITSITNFISFFAGIATPYRHTQVYAVYCIAGVAFCYFYQLIFFGSCMALSGYREQKKLNPYTFKPVLQRQNDKKESWITNLLFRSPPTESYKNAYSVWPMVFFRDHFSKILLNDYSRIVIVVMFFIYLGVAAMGCTAIKEGMDYRHVFQPNSPGWKYMDWNVKYFVDYPHRVQLVIDEELDYSDPLVQEKVEGILQRFENSSFCAGPTMTESWLRFFKHFVHNPNVRLLVRGFNVSVPEEFYYVLRNIFFRFSVFRRLSSDVVFGSNGTSIRASRFLIQSKDIRDSASEKTMLTSMQALADSSEYKVVVSNPWFLLTEQLTFVKDICIQTVCASAVAMIVVFFLFVPNIRCSFVVAICLASIQVGVIGYMSLWNVNLDPLSLICLIMCVGFSVDFASHISYAYLSCKSKNGGRKISHALYSAGMPVVQGASTTVLGAFFLLFSPVYAFIVVFKITFLIMILASAHALLLLPVLLSLGEMSSKDEEVVLETEEPELHKLTSLHTNNEISETNKDITTVNAVIE